MRKFTMWNITIITALWVGAAWAGPQTWQVASLKSQSKMSDLHGTPIEAKKPRKPHLQEPRNDGTTLKLKMSDLNGTGFELAKKGKKVKHSENG